MYKSRETAPQHYSRFRAFFRFSAPLLALAAVRLTAFVAGAIALFSLAIACESPTFEAAGPSGAGDVWRSLLGSLAPTFSRPVSSTLDGETWSGPDESGFEEVEEEGVMKVVTGCCERADGAVFKDALEVEGFKSSSADEVLNSVGGTYDQG